MSLVNKHNSLSITHSSFKHTERLLAHYILEFFKCCNVFTVCTTCMSAYNSP